MLRNNLASYLDDVSENDAAVLISRFGKPIAVLSPYRLTSLPSFEGFFGFLGKTETGEKFLSRVRRSKNESRRTASFREQA